MRHTLDGAAFEAPPTLGDLSDYAYASPDQTAILIVQVADEEPLDDAALLANAQKAYLGTRGPSVIYSSPVTFQRADGSPVRAIEGEEREMNDAAKRRRFAIAAIATDHGKGVILYSCPSGPNSLAVVRDALRGTYLLGDPVPKKPLRKGWRRRQASRILLAVPPNWTSPKTLTFCSEFDLEITVAESLAPEGQIDWARALPGVPVQITDSKTEHWATKSATGWAGEWLVAGVAPALQMLVRKLSVALANTTIVTAYAKGSLAATSGLDAAWGMVRGSIAADGGVP
jgi:hypothetical protein